MALLLQMSSLMLPIAGTDAAEAPDSRYKTAGGLSVYLGVLPAEMVRGHPEDHPEETMHGGIPRGAHTHHVIVAIFDSANGKRVEDAVVTARVSPLALGSVSRRLEAMEIAETVTYGNYFDFPGRDAYRIAISISRPAAPSPVNLEFSYEHDE